MLSMAVRWRPTAHWMIDAGFSEDVVVESAPDITFFERALRALALSTSLPRREQGLCLLDCRFYLIGRGTAKVIARRDGAIQRQHGKDILFDVAMKGLQRCQRQLREVTAGGHAMSDGLAHDFMGVAERHPGAHQIVRQIGCG